MQYCIKGVLLNNTVLIQTLSIVAYPLYVSNLDTHYCIIVATKLSMKLNYANLFDLIQGFTINLRHDKTILNCTICLSAFKLILVHDKAFGV